MTIPLIERQHEMERVNKIMSKETRELSVENINIKIAYQIMTHITFAIPLYFLWYGGYYKEFIVGAIVILISVLHHSFPENDTLRKMDVSSASLAVLFAAYILWKLRSSGDLPSSFNVPLTLSLITGLMFFALGGYFDRQHEGAYDGNTEEYHNMLHGVWHITISLFITIVTILVMISENYSM